MKRIIKMLIPNATSPRNLGDKAMLDGMVVLLQKISKRLQIIVHSSDPQIYDLKEKIDFKMKHTFYSWAVLNQKGIITRVSRTIQLLILLIGLKRQVPVNILPVSLEVKYMTKNFIEADVVFFAGGGYLRSKKGLKQSLNLIMQCYPFIVGYLLKKRMVVGPISFGPFAYIWHEKIVTYVLNKTKLVAAREEISYTLMKKAGVENVMLTSDFAFFLKIAVKPKKKNNKLIVGLTVRNWFKNESQLQFENEIIESIKKIAKKENLIIQPIVQVNAPMYGDEDAVVAERIVKELEKSKIKIASIAHPTSVKEAINIYRKLDLLVGMRMHSNILAGISGVPFIGISYEHKTRGIMEQLNLAHWEIDSEKLERRKLFALITEMRLKRKKVKKILNLRLNHIRRNEKKHWRNILSKYLYN